MGWVEPSAIVTWRLLTVSSEHWVLETSAMPQQHTIANLGSCFGLDHLTHIRVERYTNDNGWYSVCTLTGIWRYCVFAFMLIFAMNAVSFRSSLRRERISVECTVSNLLECSCVKGGHPVTTMSTFHYQFHKQILLWGRNSPMIPNSLYNRNFFTSAINADYMRYDMLSLQYNGVIEVFFLFWRFGRVDI